MNKLYDADWTKLIIIKPITKINMIVIVFDTFLTCIVLITDIRCSERNTYPISHNMSDMESCFCSVIPSAKYKYNKFKSAQNHSVMPSVKNKYDLAWLPFNLYL